MNFHASPSILRFSLCVSTAALSSTTGGCIINTANSGTSTENPGDAAESGEAEDTASARKPRVTDTMGTARVRGAKAGDRVVRKLEAKKPSRDPDAPSKPEQSSGAKLGVESLSPTMMTPGSRAVLSGSGFGQAPAGVTVTVSGVTWQVIRASPTELEVEVPAAAKSGESIKVSTRGRNSASGAGPVTVLEGGGFASPVTDVIHGLLGSVYAIGEEVSELPSFGELGAPLGTIGFTTVNASGAAPDLPGITAGRFGLHLRGSLNIVAADEGEYEFCLQSSDGSQLYLDEQLVVNNDGIHAAEKTACELVFVESGEYAVDILYFHGGSDDAAALRWTWKGETGAAEPVPSRVLILPGR